MEAGLIGPSHLRERLGRRAAFFVALGSKRLPHNRLEIRVVQLE